MLKVLSITLVLSWIALIFSFSMQDAYVSSEVSKGFTKDIIRVIGFLSQDIALAIDLDTFHAMLRSFAHFILYFFLGLWVVSALKYYFNDWFRLLIDSTLFGLIIAIFDELYQSMVPGRVMSMNDIFIDTLGVLLGSILMVLVVFKGP